jgi:hypothetical protein
MLALQPWLSQWHLRHLLSTAKSRLIMSLCFFSSYDCTAAETNLLGSTGLLGFSVLQNSFQHVLMVSAGQRA